MTDFGTEAERQKAEYKTIFTECARTIRNEIDKFKPDASCKSCTIPCDIQKPDIFAVFPPTCPYAAWQIKALSYLTNEYMAKLKVSKKAIMEKRKEYSCNKCGGCCKIAILGEGPIQLKQKAVRGDKFAREFLSIYVPYDSEEIVEAICPEYYAKLQDSMDTDERLYFYYCSKLDANNLCSDYENRPDICKKFPPSPLKTLPDECGYLPWHNAVNKLAMSIKAREDLIAFYKERLG